ATPGERASAWRSPATSPRRTAARWCSLTGPTAGRARASSCACRSDRGSARRGSARSRRRYTTATRRRAVTTERGQEPLCLTNAGARSGLFEPLAEPLPFGLQQLDLALQLLAGGEVLPRVGEVGDVGGRAGHLGAQPFERLVD